MDRPGTPNTWDVPDTLVIADTPDTLRTSALRAADAPDWPIDIRLFLAGAFLITTIIELKFG